MPIAGKYGGRIVGGGLKSVLQDAFLAYIEIFDLGLNNLAAPA